MRWRPWFWLCVSLLCFVGAAYFWQLGERWAAEKAATQSTNSTNHQSSPAPAAKPVTHSQLAPMRLLSQPGNLNYPPSLAQKTQKETNAAPPVSYRLSNNPQKAANELVHSDQAILLGNAFIDTTKPAKLAIPDSLSAKGDPGSYIVQARGPIDNAFRLALKNAGASIVAYIPNNAYLVRASQAVANQLEAGGLTQAVLPYEPYYKLNSYLLRLAVEQNPLPDGTALNLLLFSDAQESVLPELARLGVEVLGQERSPFGQVLKVLPPVDSVAALAGLPGVQIVEPAHQRILANDLSRAALRVAADSVTPSNYLGLTGSKVLVAVADTGVDTNHPDLNNGKVVFDSPISGVDTNGHGTHVAGSIAGTGAQSLTVTNAQGSIMPATNIQFRGKAPAAKLLAMDLNKSDSYLQETAARTNALISNNSWTYGAIDYDLAAASYDAAVRDSIPERTGSQALVYVFPSGNGGGANIVGSGANEGGTGGNPDSIQSPGTAKNVITVGGVEQLRGITNMANIDPTGGTNEVMPWFGSTDSSNQIASFSGRGNVGIAIEGLHGRFKPDVVAPATFVLSTRSGQWNQAAYYDSTDFSYDTLQNLVVNSNSTWVSGIFVPANATELVVSITLSDSFFPLWIYVTSPNNVTVANTNSVSIPPATALDPTDDFWQYVISNNTPQAVRFNVQTLLVLTNNSGDFFEVLSNMNDSLGGFYRYESGTSMAAANVSGTLALMEQFFADNLNVTNSPALMKALLINGARSLGNAYNFQVQSGINYQGWGQVQLPNTIPMAITNLAGSPNAPSPMYFFDQNPTNALATGGSQTRTFTRAADAQAEDLRITLAWTDPPANPVASVKLVNDLDLIVTNLDTGEVYFGNDIRGGNDYNLPVIDFTNQAPPLDIVNNVENVYIHQPACTNFSVTVVGHRVNVNAVSANPDQVAQDYALVVSSGDGLTTDALTLSPNFQNVFVTLPNVLWVTNTFPSDPENPVSGGLFLHQHVGANTPLLGTNTIPLPTDANAQITLGMTNQWHFYVLSNDMNFTNASFVTFLPPDLSVPRMGVTNYQDVNDATRPQADIDMYVSRDPGLTNLDPIAVAGADKSLSRGGTEFIVYTNVPDGAVYYVGIKSEDQMAAEYAFLGVFSLFPPTSTDTNGNRYLRGMPVPAVIPPGTPPNPQAALVLGLDVMPVTVRRVIVTNTFTHNLPGSLLGNLSHDQKFAVLNNHTCATDASGNCITNAHDYIYEDNGEGNVFGSRPSDGPGNLKDFIGEEGLGVWLLTMVSDFPSSTGVVNRLTIKLEPQSLTNGVIHDVLPNTFVFDSIEVPPDATNLTVCVSGNSQIVDLYVRRGVVPSTTAFDYSRIITPPGGCLSISTFDNPPLIAGRYYIGVFNPAGNVTQRIRISATIFRNPYAVASTISSFAGPVRIADDAITYAYITNLSHLTISSLDIGLLINHPRISDLAITLISPNGTRVLLFEDRGAGSTNGLGTFSAITNGFGVPVFAITNMAPFYTNNFDDVATGFYAPGAEFDGWNVLTNYARVYPELPAPWLSNNVLVLGDGVVSNTLPTTNSSSYSLSFTVTHAPYLFGTVAWWPLDGDGTDIVGGLNGLLSGDVLFNSHTGMVNQAFFGDGTATRMMVPRCADLDVGQRRGFTIEGWVRPENISTGQVVTGSTVMSDGFENATPGFGYPTGSIVSGWLVESGDVDVLSPQPPFNEIPDSGSNCLDLNGYNPGAISTNFNTTPGQRYQLSFAFTRNPGQGIIQPDFVAQATVSLTGQPDWVLSYGFTNTLANPAWHHTSYVFTASAPLTKLKLTSLNPGNGGMFLDSFRVSELDTVSSAAPIVEWNGVTNGFLQGAQFWLSGLPSTNTGPGSLCANLWDTNLQPHLIFTITNAVTNGGWQHVALTFDQSLRQARLYTNGQLAAFQIVSTTNFLPLTSGDLYLGYHPAPGANYAAFQGGLDEFGLYSRALSDCEIQAIYTAGTGGKYGTNVLWCPVTNAVQLVNSLNPLGLNYIFTNGLTWRTNGTQWETNTIYFNDLPQVAYTNGPVTNYTAILLTNFDQNAALDNFVLSSLTTNYINGLLHFNENRNLSLVPIKFGPWPYMVSNFPPTLIFSNDFEMVTQRVCQAGTILPGSTNDPTFGPRNWTVVSGPVTVISNTLADAVGTNCMALAGGSIQCTLPTTQGHRYQLSYTVRGPGAVSWWSGDVEPLSSRAWDLLGGNNGAFIYDATNSAVGLVDALGDFNALSFPGIIDPTNGLCSKIEVGDPPNLALTNAFTIEGWIRPLTRTNYVTEQVEQILFRGDGRDCLDPYYLAVERVSADQLDLLFHIENGDARDCGITLETFNQPIFANRWQHIAAVFESNVILTNPPAWRTNQLRLYVNGQRLFPQNHDVMLEDPTSASPWNDLTGRFPFRDLDPSFSPGVAIGNRSRHDYSQPFRGYIDELSVYGRALTDAEIAAIAAVGAAGKADFRVPPAFGLAKVNVLINDVLLDTGYGNNSEWTTRSFSFTADQTNLVLTLQSLLPGTLVDGITLTELPAELNYLPEDPLSVLNGEDAFGVWTLEMWDTRTGAFLTNDNPALLEWQLNFILQPSNPPPVIHLVHGIPYTNLLTAHGIQNFIVDVPQWALNATNVLLFAGDSSMTNSEVVGVLWDLTNQVPTSLTNALFWPPVSSGVTNLTTNTASSPYIVPGQPYYLTVTNPNPFSISFAYGVWFDIVSLTNCQSASNFVWQAGIPRYFQFDVPTNAVPPGAPTVEALFYLTGAGTNSVGWQSNLTVVLSQHLPLPDLTHYDYISSQPCTNDDIILVLTNTTPFPVQNGRWYAGVFSSASTNIPFTVQACYTASNYPVIITLTNGVPFVANFTNRFVAPPGPPQWFFFKFELTNSVDGLLFELYNLSGNADLVLERDVPPGMAPYFAGSFQPGRNPEQIVLRSDYDVPDLMGRWFLGVYNNETTNVAYTIRAVTRQGGLLQSGQPLQSRLLPMPPPHGLLMQWNSVRGEYYEIDFSPSLAPPNWQILTNGLIQSTTPLTTFEVPIPAGGFGFYRVRQVSTYSLPTAPLTIQFWTNNLIRISWSINFPGETLQASTTPFGPWTNVNQPVVIEGAEFVVYDPVGTQPRYYRLVP